MQATIAKIEAELKRLGVNDTPKNVSGICVYADDDLPRGWVRISDGTGEVFGESEAVLAVLAAVPVTGEVTDDGASVDWEATWEALGEFQDLQPTSDTGGITRE